MEQISKKTDMSSRFALAITGPAGSGKSTIGSKLGEQIEQCVNIDVDHIKHMIVNGFVYDQSLAGIKQWELLGKNIGLLAHNFHQSGYNVIINGYVNESAWGNIVEYIALTHKVLLLPDLATVKARDTARQEGYVVGEETVTMHHDYFSNASFCGDFTKIDSTSDTIGQTVDKAFKILGKNKLQDAKKT